MTPLLADRPARGADAPPGRDAALRRSESLLGLVWEGAADGMRLTTSDGMVVMANPAYCRMVGRPPAEVVGRCFADAYAPAARGVILAKHRDRFSDAGDRPRETHVELADGRRVCFEFSNAPLDMPGEPPLLLTITRDVTARKAAEAEAGAWQARYEAAVRATGQVLYDWDVSTGRLTWGGSCAETLGYTPDEMPADLGGWAALVHPDDWPAVGAEVDRVVATGEAFRLEYRLRPKDGSYVVVEDRGQFVHGAAGGLRMVGFLADVTVRATAQRAVQEREELLHSVLAHIPDGVFWKDRDSVYLGCNDRVARDSGLASPAELVGTTDLDTVVAPAEAEHYRACDRRVMDAGEPLIGIEETRTMPDGRVLDLLTSKVPLRDAAGAVVGVLGVYRDVTDRNRAEAALRRSQALFRAFMDNTPAVAFIKDADGRYVYANRRWEEQFDTPRRDWAGRTDADFWPPEAAAAFRASDRAALEPGWSGSVEEV
ncbi:MAG TPA: PAS domain-containing protein, partial [Urbifossiella sp.]|nr:PAS domain-containing protein [Urbifossiella sp.]